MAADLFDWDWQWEYKHRGTLNYEHRTHYRELLVKKRPIVKLDFGEFVGKATRGIFQSKYAGRGKDSRELYDSDEESEDEMFHETKYRPVSKKRPLSVYIVPQGRQLRWGRTGRKGYTHYKEERDDLSDDTEESESDSEEVYYCRWPSPAPHKGGRPYEKPRDDSYKAFFSDKSNHNKSYKRHDWRKKILDESTTDFYRKDDVYFTETKISVIDTETHKYINKFQQKRRKQTKSKEKGDVEQIRAERRHKKERNEKPEIVPPFIENAESSLGTPDDSISEKTNGDNERVVKRGEEFDQGGAVKSMRDATERGRTATEQENEGSMLIKLLRESTRPDTLQTEFRRDYKEAACKPRRFAINISRIVFHHVTLMNRLRLRAIPKLDLTTYLVFTYCKDSNQGVDLFRVHVASTWASSAKKALFHFHSALNGNVTQIQELIQCVVSVIDNVDLRYLVAKENRQNKKNNHYYNRPTCNFPMLFSVMKWEFTNTSIPRATEWYSKEDAEDKGRALFNINGLRHFFETAHYSESNQDVKRGPCESHICGGCLLEKSTDGGNKLMALDVCSHWFCEQCWKSRLLRQIKKADLSLKAVAICVEDGCDNPVDPITLLTLLSVDKIRSVIESKIRSHVSLLAPNVIICPNKNCRQVFSILEKSNSRKLERAIPIVCRCSLQFCSNCLNSPHWPAPCEYARRYKEFTKQRKDDVLLSKLLLDHELPDDLLSGKKCFNCGRFVRQFVFRKTEPNEFGRPICLQCAKEDNQNKNFNHSNIFNSNYIPKDTKNTVNSQLVDSKITKWYKIASTHRKMKHPEVVKALYGMAEIVADKLVCAVTAGKYVGDANRAAAEWDDLLLEWAEDNYSELCKSYMDGSNENSGAIFTEKQTLDNSLETSTRVTSASSNSSEHSFTNSSLILSSDNSFALSKLSAPKGDKASDLSSEMKRAACNIVHLKLELHQTAEYVAVLLDYEVALRGKLIRCLERAEDLCFSLGILLQDPHVHNAPRVLSTFMRLRVQAKHAIENIWNEIDNVKIEI
ncbi:E3 ubiquitin-protein ligase arih1 [Elysia marginata]|uniref:RBR-type E3 ubiquitin transferase n=1 Tax=Elysia marginata TaxID=1093978 RepID=A0AAV4EL61_9GAST|nr:E3 ubiquitin-protein ligase arih1 [Elysia marginata]